MFKFKTIQTDHSEIEHEGIFNNKPPLAFKGANTMLENSLLKGKLQDASPNLLNKTNNFSEKDRQTVSHPGIKVDTISP